MSSWRRAAIGAAALAVLAAVGPWLLAAQALRDGFADWAAEQRQRGAVISWSELEVGGFPWRLDARLVAPRYGSAGRWLWQGPDITLRSGLLQPRQVDIAAPGRHRIAAAGGLPVAVDAATLDGRLDFDRAWQPRRLRAAATGIALRGGGAAGGSGAGRIEAAAELAPGGDGGTGHLALAAAATGIALPPGLRDMLGPEIDEATLEARVTGTLAAAPLPEALRIWRDSGGIVEVSRFDLRWGELTVAADGTAALDAALQPEAAFATRSAGLAGLVDRLAGAGLLSGLQSIGTKLLIAALGRTPAGGGPAVVALPVTVQDRTLTVGRMALGELPEIRWR